MWLNELPNLIQPDNTYREIYKPKFQSSDFFFLKPGILILVYIGVMIPLHCSPWNAMYVSIGPRIHQTEIISGIAHLSPLVSSKTMKGRNHVLFYKITQSPADNLELVFYTFFFFYGG